MFYNMCVSIKCLIIADYLLYRELIKQNVAEYVLFCHMYYLYVILKFHFHMSYWFNTSQVSTAKIKHKNANIYCVCGKHHKNMTKIEIPYGKSAVDNHKISNVVRRITINTSEIW